jgi:hypothetical protein
MATPIFKDYEVTLGTSESADYTIRTSTSTDDIIYSGTAFKKPGESNVKITINEVCVDYMGQEFPALSSTGLIPCDTYIKTFYVYVGSTQKASVDFLFDFSYDYSLANSLNPYSMADPVDGVIDVRMPLIHTMRMNSGTIDYYDVGNSFDNSFDLSFDTINSQPTSVSGYGNYVRLSSIADIGHAITFQETSGWTTYLFKNTCARFALYYVNEYGGWDSLVMQGGFKRTDRYKRYEMKRKYNNAVPTNRGRWRYANEETFAYELRTRWRTDDMASRMHHLIGSNMVYLYDLYNGICQPVVITDNACEYKTYKGNGLKMVQYAINVEIAKEQTRR